ncbi:10798_t:CDS:2 [Ambispora leptoticha]|uniref:10798_t:CDS:1 n=1 Tax=Ambispora leptoticha TaxID=144679 RepID=A0A9N9HEE8_9GLOM|nr:10798_t:CDS:2 [Ambispora leptoticha]
MNPCDHPHGGGEQKAGIGHPSPLRRHDNGRKQDNPTNDENSNESENQDIDPNQDFIKKGYSDKDIQELTAEKRRGVVNTLAVAGKEGSCESHEDEQFCSKECVDKRYPKTYEEGKIVAIGGIGRKVSAAVEKDCDTIVIPKSNSSDYQNEVPLSVRAKVKKLHELLEKVKKANEEGKIKAFKTWARGSVISPEMIGHTLLIHNGKMFFKRQVTSDMVGHKAGEFSPTRKSGQHGKAGTH